MAIIKTSNSEKYIGLSTDTKPTGVPPGSAFLESDTGKKFTCYDGTNWAQDSMSAMLVGDIEIGAVEMKDAATDTRAKIGALSGLATSDNGIPVAALLLAGASNVGKVDPNTATLTIYNVTLTNANTEYSQALPANCRGFEFQCQTGVQCRWSNVTGKVATPTAPWMTLRPNAWYVSPPLNQGASPSTLYFGSATAGAIIELIAYV